MRSGHKALMIGFGYDTDDTVVKDVAINGNSGKLFIRKKDN